jgi:hypothetical protein
MEGTKMGVRNALAPIVTVVINQLRFGMKRVESMFVRRAISDDVLYRKRGK